jgi:hypothetical protein
MKDAVWALKILNNEVQATQGQDNYARAIAADVIAEYLGKERGCMYCEEEVHLISEKSYCIIKDNLMRVYKEEKLIGSYKIRRCPICGKRLD